MNYLVIEEAPERVRWQAADALHATRGVAVSRERYDWLYCDNPDGPAVIWTICDRHTGKFNGFSVGLPRRILVDGQMRTCWVASDFSIYQEYRTLDVAMDLRRAAQRGVDAGRADFLYAHPNPRLQFIHERAENQCVGAMVRLAKVLRSRSVYARRMKHPWLTRPLAAATDPLMRLASREGRFGTATRTRLMMPARFDERFDGLFEAAAAARPVIGVRDARYLHWRYAANPLYRTHAVLLEEGKRLLGYALFKLEGRVAHLLDVLAVPEQHVPQVVIAGLIEHARRLELDSISAIVLQGHPLASALRGLGFLRRPEKAEMFAYVSPKNPLRWQVLDSRCWYATAGDRDV